MNTLAIGVAFLAVGLLMAIVLRRLDTLEKRVGEMEDKR